MPRIIKIPHVFIDILSKIVFNITVPCAIFYAFVKMCIRDSVGGVQISSTGYWTTDSDGTVTSAGNTQPGDNYIHYNANDNILTLHNATIKKGLAYDQNTPAGITIHGSAIGVLNQSGDAELTVQLEGSNTIDEVSTGIYVHSSGGGAALSITGNGTLVIDSIFCPIQVISFNGNAALSIENVKVTATSSYDNGRCV